MCENCVKLEKENIKLREELYYLKEELFQKQIYINNFIEEKNKLLYYTDYEI
jgi:hypothetical protein